MNGSTNKGQADGFDIEILKKLSNIKSSKRHSVTLFDYIVQCSHKNIKNIHLLGNNMQNVQLSATKGKLNEIKMRCNGLIHKFKGIENNQKLFDMNKKDDVKFLEFIKQFVDDNKSKIDDVKSLMSETEKQYTKTVLFFDDKSHKTLNASQEFMKLFADFVLIFDKKIKQHIASLDNDDKSEENKKKIDHRKHNLGKTIPAFSTQKSSALLINELKHTLSKNL